MRDAVDEVGRCDERPVTNLERLVLVRGLGLESGDLRIIETTLNTVLGHLGAVTELFAEDGDLGVDQQLSNGLGSAGEVRAGFFGQVLMRDRDV